MATVEEVMLTDIKHNRDLVKEADGGDLSIVTGLENIRDAIFRRLITEPGSIVHRHTYGVGIKRFQNAPNTEATRRAIALRIDEQLSSESRIEKVLGVRFGSDDHSPSKITITIRVRLVGYGDAKFEFSTFDEVS